MRFPYVERTDCVVVLVTCPNIAVAKRIASSLVKNRLAACVNIVPHVESVFSWKGKIERCQEALLVMKTAAVRFDALKQAVRKLHPYDVPEVIALPIRAGHVAYLDWVLASTASPTRRSA